MLKKIVEYTAIVIIILILSYFLAPQFGILYTVIFSDAQGGGFIPLEAAHFIAGAVPALLFCTSLLIMLLGSKSKYIVVLILEGLIIARAYYTGLLEITGLLFPLISCLIGLVIGLGMSRIIKILRANLEKKTTQDKI